MPRLSVFKDAPDRTVSPAPAHGRVDDANLDTLAEPARASRGRLSRLISERRARSRRLALRGVAVSGRRHSRAGRAGAIFRSCLTASLLVAAAVSGVCAQQRPDAVTLVQEPCAGYDQREFEKLLAIELRAVGVKELLSAAALSDVRARAGLALVHLACAPDEGGVNANIADFVSGNQLRRELPIADVEQRARARVLALAVAGLIETSWLALAARGPGAPDASSLPYEVRVALRRRLREAFVDTEHPPALKPEPQPAQSSQALPTLAMFVLTRNFPSRGTALIGADLSYLAALASLRILVSADVLGGSQELQDAAGTFANMLFYWISAGLGVMWATETVPELSIGPYLRAGRSMATATDLRTGYKGHDQGRFVACAGVAAILRASISPKLSAFVGLDLGYTPSGVVFYATQIHAAGMAGITVAARLGLGLGL